MNNQTTQEAFAVIERLAALVATPGVDEKTQKMANEIIQNIMSSVVKEAATKLSARGAGLLV